MKKIYKTKVVGKIMLLAAMLLAGMTAKAQTNYVFVYNNNTYIKNNGETLESSTGFTPGAVWRTNNGNLGGTARTITSYIDNTKGLYYANSQSGNLSLNANSSNWYGRNNTLCSYYGTSNANAYYPKHNAGNATIAQRNNGNRYTYYVVNSITDHPAVDNLVSPQISVGSVSGNTITMAHTAITGTYTPAYTTYVYNTNSTHNWDGTSDLGTGTPSAVNANAMSPTYRWSLTANGGGVATIDEESGVLTLSGAPASNITVRLTVSNLGTLSNKTVDFTLTRAAIAQGSTTEATITGPTISPTTAALYKDDAQAFTASASASSVTTTVPAHITLTGDGNTYYYYNGALYTSTSGFSTSTATPLDVTLAWTKTGSAASYLTFSTTSGSSTTVTHATQSPSDLTATITVTASASGASNQTASATVTAYGPMVAPTITRTGNTITLATTSVGATIYYTTDGTTTPSAINGTLYTAPFDLTTSPTTVKAITIRDGRESTVTTSEEFQITLPAPVITISNTGLATITAEYGAEIHYTTDGSTPTDGSAPYSGAVPLSSMQTIKAIAVKSGFVTSAVAEDLYVTTCITSSTVIIDDREDHNWSYYCEKPDTDYPDILLSPDPRNVKIIYDGNGGEVSYNESANEFVYYKTIEKINGTYTYKVIPNPFSKRPTVGAGDARWRGFGGWKIISGGEYINGHNNNDVLTLEETLTLTGLDAGYTKNCISATIELQATWVQAYVSTVNAAGNIAARPNTLTGSTYETNFIVILDNRDHTVSGTGRVTISNRYPDGSAGGTGRVSGCTSVADGTKIEFTNISGTFTESAGPLIVGRGCTGTVNEVTGDNTNRVKNIRLESGTYSFVHPMQGMGDNAANRGNFVFGCDYDRANVTNVLPYGDNTKLRIVVFTAINGSGGHANNNTDDLLNITIKSGYYGFTSDFDSWQTNKNDGWGLGVGGNTDNVSGNYIVPDQNGVERTYTWGTKPPQNTMSFYVGPTRGGGKGGRNVLRIEGGELSSVNGGGTTTPDEFIRFDMRMTGGWVKGAIYGGASAVDCNGSSRIVITGGEVNSWIGGGCNGTDIEAGAGATNGTIYIYAGGDAQIRSHNSDGVYNNAWGLVNYIEGGQIFGGGRGMGAAGSYSGSATNSYVVVADESYVEQNVYGGSCHGVSQYGRVYILGGTVGKKVFGGSFEPTSTNATWQAKNTYVRMYGGWVKEGIYGGNDADGTVTQNTDVLIVNGTVGTGNAGNGVFGGGFGSATRVSGNVDVTIGDATLTENLVINGDVYGGSALGYVNGTTATNTYHTYVTLNKGTIYGSLYGGALGQKNGVNGATSDIAANVYGPVHVVVNGGSVIKPAGNPGGVFGANNLNGAPQRSVVVDIYGTDPAPDASHYALNAVYGGGNMADYIYNDYPTVTVHNCDNSIGGVYGGGNAAAVRQTLVTVYGGNKIGQVFGGGNGTDGAADVTVGGTTVNIHGGTIEQVFGGSNTAGTITGAIAVTLNKEGDDDPEGTSTPCDMKVGEVYGGGNQANSQAGSITIGCTGTLTTQAANPSAVGHTLEGIGDVYGGARMADITSGDITLNMYSGMVNRVFGGNNISGSIAGDITVNINKNNGAGCASDWYCGEVYGGGNMADYDDTPEVNIINGTVERDVYGGGNNITADNVGVAGGKVTMTGGQVRGNVFGGCNTKGTVTGTTSVSISAGTVNGSVFGGGLGSGTSVTGKATVTLSGTAHVDTDVYGGGSQGTVLGGTQVTIKE